MGKEWKTEIGVVRKEDEKTEIGYRRKRRMIGKIITLTTIWIIGWCSVSKIDSISCKYIIIIDVLQTPALDNAQKQALFGVICYIWAEGKDDLMIMTIWTTNNFLGRSCMAKQT